MTENETIQDHLPEEGEEVSETPPEEDFAALFEQRGPGSGRLEPGQRVRATIAGISGDFVYIDLGGKSEGVIDISEFQDEAKGLKVKPGDAIEAYFLSVHDGMRRLTTRTRGLSTVDLYGLSDAHEAGLPVNGKVASQLKGGFEVYVGKVRCFCPFSQIDLKGSREPEAYVGNTYPFKVIEYGEDGRNVILSRRALLEEEQRNQVTKLKEGLAVGMDVSAKVASIQNFGAFVDLGGLEGLIPLSEMGWGRTSKADDLLSIGQEVTVRIIALDWARNRITLSLKALQPDPWEGIAERYQVDNVVHGSIVRLSPFGAFVNLEPGVDGLVHISKLGAGRRITHPKEVVEVGQWVEAYVQEVDETKKRISLTMEDPTKKEIIPLPSVGELLEGVVERVLTSGILLKVSSGLTGFIPNSEMGTIRGTNHITMFPIGTSMQVAVIEVDDKRNRFVLSRGSAGSVAEKAEFNQYVSTLKEGEKSAGGLGSLGELLMASMQKKKGD